MKTNHFSSLAVSSLIVMAASSVHAIERMGWERPIYQARMKVTSAVGEYKYAKDVNLTMTKQDGQSNFFGFILRIDGQEIFFKNVSKTTDSCGSTQYVALSHQSEGSGNVENHKLLLIDHSTRICEDYRPYRWEASLEHTSLLLPPNNHEIAKMEVMGLDEERTESLKSQVLGSLEMSGHPESVYTIQTIE